MYSMLLVHSLLMLLLIDATSCLSTRPVDHVVVVNCSTVFECSSNQSVIWTFRRTGQLADKRIYAGDQPGDPRYSLNRSSDDSYGLVISDVQLSDSGLYTCIDNDGFGPAASARLVVLASLPTCGANVSVTQPVVESQIIELRCTLIYAGNPPPRVRWTAPAIGTVNSSTTSTSTSTTQTDGDLSAVRLESWIVVIAAVRGVGPYRYAVTIFGDGDDDGTESALTPMYVWNSSSFVVLYAVRNVVINASDDGQVVRGATLHCRAEGFPPARYDWRSLGTGRTSAGPDLQVDAEGQYTYECTATNVVANVTYSARADVRLRVIGPTTTHDLLMTSSADSVVTAVVIATMTTAVIAVLVVSCVCLVYRLFRRQQRSSTRATALSSLTRPAAVISRHQVCAYPPQAEAAAAAVLRDADNNTRKGDVVSCLYDSIDEQYVGYEQLPGGRLSEVQQSAAASHRPRLPCSDAVNVRDAVRRSPRRTLTENDYLYICDESGGETGQSARCLRGQSNIGVRYVQPQQPPQEWQDDALYVNDGLATTPAVSSAPPSDEGVYIHTL